MMITDQEDNRKSMLVKKAELLMELRGYQNESVTQSDESVDIKASKPDSDETVLLHIVAKSELKSNGVGVQKVEETEQILGEPDVDQVILFGNTFSDAARRRLRAGEIEFFSKEHNIISTFNQQELYAKILDSINELCLRRCGHVPQSESECEGFAKDPVECPFCNGTGKHPSPTGSREQKCPVCGGFASKKTHYPCKIRLISDNTDFHFESGWTYLLQNDLRILLELLRQTKIEAETSPLALAVHTSPADRSFN